MALFLITVKQSRNCNGVRIEKGMNVQVASSYSNPLITNGGHEVLDAFMRVYGIDLKKGNSDNAIYLDVKKIG